jgi:hypothetical protein
VECKNKSYTSNNRGNWNHLKIIQKISEQRNGKARNQENTKNSHTGYCTHTAESANVKHKTCEIALYVAKLQIQNSCKNPYPRNIVCFRYSAKGDNE